MSSTTPIWISAAASATASIVALFGPGFRRWWMRPRITLHEPVDPMVAGDELIFASDDGPSREHERNHFVVLELTNHGRSQLDDVEAILAAYQRFGPITAGPGDADVEEIPVFEVPVVSHGLLQFELSTADHPRVTIPPGATRVLRLAVLGSDEAIRRELDRHDEESPHNGVRVSGAFALWPLPGARRAAWLLDDDAVTIEITINARNAKSRSWGGTVRAWAWSGMQDEEVDISGLKFEWDRRLHRLRRRTPPTPTRAWITSHTPWALWSRWRFRREMERLESQPGETGRPA